MSDLMWCACKKYGPAHVWEPGESCSPTRVPPTPVPSEADPGTGAACSDWPGACQHTPAHDNGRLTPEYVPATPDAGDASLTDDRHSSTDASEAKALPAHFRPCLKCGTSVLMTYRTEADPVGRPADHDCEARVEAVETLAEALHRHICAAMFAHYGPAKKCEQVARAVLASDWLASHDAATADRMRREEAMAAMEDAAKIAETCATGKQAADAIRFARDLAAQIAREAGR